MDWLWLQRWSIGSRRQTTVWFQEKIICWWVEPAIRKLTITVVSLSPTLVIILGHAVSTCVVNVNFYDFFALSRPTNTNTRGHKYKLFKPRCTASIRQQFFVDRVINVWNALPSTANFASLNVLGIAFKRLISPVFLVCNIFICVIEYAPSDCFIERLGQLLVFLSDLAVLLF